MRVFGIKNPSSSPYISGDTFRSIAKYVYDEEQSFDPKDVKAGDIVFVSLRKIGDYFKNFHPYIRSSYVLITHNGDIGIDKQIASNHDKKITHWFSQNVLIKHPNIVPIPIGLENFDYYNHGIISIFNSLRNQSVQKKSKILYGFSISTNPSERASALNVLKSLQTADSVPERLNSQEYFQLLNAYKFVASPPGNGWDCHRTWEAMYLQTIPIVLSTQASISFVEDGLPMLVISDWNELRKFSEDDLDKLYRKIIGASDARVLWMNYWRTKIQKVTAKQYG